MLYKINKIFFGIYVIIITERGTERVLKKERKIKMVEIITKELTNRGRTEHEYKGTVKLEDVTQKKAIIDLLDRNNFGGYVEVRETEEKNIYTFNATVYID